MAKETRPFDYSNMFLYSLPSPRLKFWENASVQVTQDGIMAQTNEIMNALGFYPFTTKFDLLGSMLHGSSLEVMFIGLIFNVLLIMFIGIAVLLIYSLLMISVETKTFEIGVMRLVGLSKKGFTGMILTQASMFVIPAFFTGLIVAMPCIFLIYKLLFTESMGFTSTVFPGASATLQAFCIGLIIPILSAVPPV